MLAMMVVLRMRRQRESKQSSRADAEVNEYPLQIIESR